MTATLAFSSQTIMLKRRFASPIAPICSLRGASFFQGTPEELGRQSGRQRQVSHKLVQAEKEGFSEIERGLTVRWGACSQLSGALEWRTWHLDFSEENGFRHLPVYPARIIDESSLPASPVKNIIHKHTNNTN